MGHDDWLERGDGWQYNRRPADGSYLIFHKSWGGNRNFHHLHVSGPDAERAFASYKPTREWLRDNLASARDPKRESGQRLKFEATCSRCSQTLSLPFAPDKGRPFYCRECNNRVREDREAEKQAKQREHDQRTREREQKQHEWEQRQRLNSIRRREEWEQRRKERLVRVSEAIERLEAAVKRDEESISRMFDKLRNLRHGRNYEQVYRETHSKIADLERRKREKKDKLSNMWFDRERIGREEFRG